MEERYLGPSTWEEYKRKHRRAYRKGVRPYCRISSLGYYTEIARRLKDGKYNELKIARGE